MAAKKNEKQRTSQFPAISRIKMLNAIVKMEIFALNRTDLVTELSGIDISVPLRTEGRTKEHCERWSICHWLSTYPRLNFPIKIIHDDKPDFYLEANGQGIGIEHTEAISQDYAHACAVSEKKSNDTVVDMSLFKWGQDKKPSEIYEIASRTKLTGPGWVGDSPEIEWAFALSELTKNKTILLRNDDFKKFPSNILLVYDNLPLPHIDYSKASSLLGDALKLYWNDGIIFNSIFVQTDDLLILISQEEIKLF